MICVDKKFTQITAQTSSTECTCINIYNDNCYDKYVSLHINLFIAVNIEDTAPILKKVVELPKPEPVRVGDADKLKQAGKFYIYSTYHLVKSSY